MEVLICTLAASSRFQWNNKHQGKKVFFRVVEVHHCAIGDKGEFGLHGAGKFSTISWEPDESYSNRHFTIKCNCSHQANHTFQARCRYHPEHYYSNDTLDAIYIQGPSMYQLTSICQMSGSSFVMDWSMEPVRIELPMDSWNAYFM
jgi:hypothetical protein